MLFENRDARIDARVTDIYGRPGDKTPDLIRTAPAERATHPRAKGEPQRACKRRELPFHPSLSAIRRGKTSSFTLC
jgi:hypothetical protein